MGRLNGNNKSGNQRCKGTAGFPVNASMQVAWPLKACWPTGFAIYGRVKFVYDPGYGAAKRTAKEREASFLEFARSPPNTTHINAPTNSTILRQLQHNRSLVGNS